MPTVAFTDENGGYYETEVREGAEPPAWAKDKTSIPVRPSAEHDWDGEQWVLNEQRKASRDADALQSELDALLLLAGYLTLPHLIKDVEVSKTVAQLGGVSEAQVYAGNPMYRQLRDLRDVLVVKEAQIKQLRGEA